MRKVRYPRAGARLACRFGCGAPVIVFRDEQTAFYVQLEAAAVSVRDRLDDDDIRHRLWEFHGQHLGWLPLWGDRPGGPARTWRPLHVEHDCDATPPTHKPRRTQPARALVADTEALSVHTTTTNNPHRRERHDRPVRHARPT